MDDDKNNKGGSATPMRPGPQDRQLDGVDGAAPPQAQTVTPRTSHSEPIGREAFAPVKDVPVPVNPTPAENSTGLSDEDRPLNRPAPPAAGQPSNEPIGRLATPPARSPDRRGFDGQSRQSGERSQMDRTASVYGALDLGTNNCRLLLARPTRRGFRVVDAFSRIIRLGEGVTQSGRLSDEAMSRTMDALRVCANKLERSRVERARLVATEACRIAENGEEFLGRVRDRLGLDIEILSREAEACLAVAGCASLIDGTVDYVLVFDIGGGSSELIWLDLTRRRVLGRPTIDRSEAQSCMAAWTSLPVGVVTLAERFGGRHVTPQVFEEMVDYVSAMLEPFEAEHGFRQRIAAAPAHLLGTSGTVTTVAGILLKLPRYDRNQVDGSWLKVDEAQNVTYSLLNRSYEERVAEPCIGRDRADLVLAGCAILEALIRVWPCERLRVADRGLREGILSTLMGEDGVIRSRRRRGQRRS